MDTPKTLPSPAVFNDGPRAAEAAQQLYKEAGIQHISCPVCSTRLAVLVNKRRDRYGFTTARCTCGNAFTGRLA